MSDDPMLHGLFPAAVVPLRDCGCGPKLAWPLNHYPNPNFIFRSDCCFHDFLYSVGGNRHARKCADQQLYWDMKLRIGELYPKGEPGHWKRLVYKPIAWLYYLAVRKGGSRAFNWTKRA